MKTPIAARLAVFSLAVLSLVGTAVAVERQGAATAGIAHSVEKAVSGAQDVAGNIAGVDKAAAETSRVAETVLATSRELTRQADSLHSEVQRFLRTVRA